MIPFLMGITTLGTVKPYFRKHILDTLHPTDYMFLNSLLISSFILAYFVYVCFFDSKEIVRTYRNCCKMSYSQFAALTFLAFFTVVSSVMLLHLDKHYNTPFLNSLMLRGFSLIILLCVSIFIFNEEYSSLHTMGIILATVGIMILVMNPVKSKV